MKLNTILYGLLLSLASLTCGMELVREEHCDEEKENCSWQIRGLSNRLQLMAALENEENKIGTEIQKQYAFFRYVTDLDLQSLFDDAFDTPAYSVETMKARIDNALFVSQWSKPRLKAFYPYERVIVANAEYFPIMVVKKK